MVGWMVGTAVGRLVGSLVGWAVGEAVGVPVGWGSGVIVGWGEGVTDGTAVGGSVVGVGETAVLLLQLAKIQASARPNKIGRDNRGINFIFLRYRD